MPASRSTELATGRRSRLRRHAVLRRRHPRRLVRHRFVSHRPVAHRRLVAHRPSPHRLVSHRLSPHHRLHFFPHGLFPFPIPLPIHLSIPGAGSIASGLVTRVSRDVVGLWFRTLERWVAGGAAWCVHEMWRAMSATAKPVLTTSSFSSEYGVMASIAVAVALPLLALAAMQAIVHQDPGALLRSALIRLPLAILFTFVAVQVVELGLAATDQASTAILSAGGDPSRELIYRLGVAMGPFGPAASGFAGFFVVFVGAVVGFLLWFELAVRAAAVAAATLFLPLALAGSAWPATAHWSRRLGETLTGLVLMKLVMAAVLSLAAGALAHPTGGATIGIAGVVEGVALLAMTAFTPFALFRLIPMVEAGAVGHLQGIGQRPVRMAAAFGQQAGKQMAMNAIDAFGEKSSAGSDGGGGGSGGGGSGGGGSGGGFAGGGPTTSASAGPASGASPAARNQPVPERGPAQFDHADVAARATRFGHELAPPVAGEAVDE